mgnify:FL=1
MCEFDFDYTTPEQSQQLLDLGVPDWTADCDYYFHGQISNDAQPEIIPRDEHYVEYSTYGEMGDYTSLPCWSVGRLIQILTKCALKSCQISFNCKKSPIQTVYDDVWACVNGKLIDFDKLNRNYVNKGRTCKKAN